MLRNRVLQGGVHLSELVDLGKELSARDRIGTYPADGRIRPYCFAQAQSQQGGKLTRIRPKANQPASAYLVPERRQFCPELRNQLDFPAGNLFRSPVNQCNHLHSAADGIIILLFGVADSAACEGSVPSTDDQQIVVTIVDNFPDELHCSSSAAGKSSIPAGMQSISINVWMTARRSSCRSAYVELTNTWNLLSIIDRGGTGRRQRTEKVVSPA